VDRDGIQRRDFPTGRRGYDPAAVDEHLRRVADEFETHLQAPRASLADSTSEQVRLILDAAERGASELRARAGEEASGHVARVQEAASGMLAKLDALESELGHLLAALRAGGERLAQGLEELQAEVAGDARVEPVVDGAGVDLPALEEDFAAASEPGDAGARLIALNMALSGSPREETARYLAEHFELDDAEALLDDVYARAGR
jgi:DivIVA domain-containing protein